MDNTNLKNKWIKIENEAKITGWDFSPLEGKFIDCNELPWDYKSIIYEYLQPNMRILDIDTGGGEFLLSLNHNYKLTSATEGYLPNVELCKKRLLPLGIDFFECNDHSKLPFNDESFDIIINRHGTYHHKEIYRLLKNGGYFITQQVGEDNDRDLVELIIPGCKKMFAGFNLKNEEARFLKAGFTIIKSFETFEKVKFLEIEALIWFAKIIEWEFIDFSVEKCFDQLVKANKIIKEKGYLEGTIHRFMLVLKKDTLDK